MISLQFIFASAAAIDADQKKTPFRVSLDENTAKHKELAEHYQELQRLNIFQSMDKREEGLSKTHYVFYSAANSKWVLMFKLYSEFRKRLNLKPAEALRNNFKEDKQNVSEFKKAFEDTIRKSNGSNPFDHLDNVRARILSASYSLFDCGIDSGESALCFFNCNRSIHDDWERIFREYLGELGLPETRISDYLTKIKSLKSSKGAFFHIFIRKDSVNDCVYLARPYGIPVEMSAPCLPAELVCKKPAPTVSGFLDSFLSQSSEYTDWKWLRPGQVFPDQARLLVTNHNFHDPEKVQIYFEFHDLDSKLVESAMQDFIKMIAEDVQNLSKTPSAAS